MYAERKVILYIAMSLDGFIAKKDDDISFLSMVEQESEDYGYSDFIRNIDTVILGRKTYSKVLEMGFGFPHSDKETYIITRTSKPKENLVNFYTGNINELIETLKNKNGKNIFVDGGAEVVNELLKDDLIDEFYISIIPILLGDGIPLFKGSNPELKLKLVSSKKFAKGLVQLHYVRQ